MTATFKLPLTKYVLHVQEVKTIDALHKVAHKVLEEFKLRSILVITENDNYTINKPGTNGK